MAEDSRTVLDKIGEKLRSKRFPNKTSNPGVTSEDFEQLLKDIVTVSHREYPKVSADREALLTHVRSSIINDNSRNTYHRLKDTMAAYEAREKIYLDEHEQLKTIENGQARRALFWRATTTFTVALIIFFFYWVADCLGIAMPLSRVAL